jgi:hypothetical protein
MPAAVKLSNTTIDQKYVLRRQLSAHGGRELYVALCLTSGDQVWVSRLAPEPRANWPSAWAFRSDV